ncbi:unnamed protein product, partial [Effrenium voratum]
REKRRHGRHGALGTSPSPSAPAPALAAAMCPRKRSRGPRLFESPEYRFADLRADDVVQGLTWRGERLGEGAFAQVLKCWSPKHGYVAVKVLKHRSFCEEVSLEAEAEAAILRSLAHPHIVRMLDFFELEGHVCLALELLGLTLLQLLEGHVQGLRQETVKEIARQVLLALEYLGRLELIHGDLKPENVLMDPGCRARGRLHVKAFQCSPSTSGAGGQVFQCGPVFVADFGAARRISDEEVTIQTLPYRAPEVLLGGRRICCKVDVWSLGAICIELYTGEPLFDHQFTQEEVVAGIDQLLGPIPEEMLCRGGGQPHDEIPVGGSAARSHVVSLRAGSERRVVRHTHRRVLRAHDAPDLQATWPPGCRLVVGTISLPRARSSVQAPTPRSAGAAELEAGLPWAALRPTLAPRAGEALGEERAAAAAEAAEAAGGCGLEDAGGRSGCAWDCE